MKLAWLTDIHLNCINEKQRQSFYASIAGAKPDGIIISGDIGEATSFVQYLCDMDAALRLPIYFVLGNHDFYRGSFARGERDAEALCGELLRLCFLDSADPIMLGTDTALIGHSSWYDVRCGSGVNSTALLNDFHLIKEINGLDAKSRSELCQARAARAVEHFERTLPDALAQAQKIILVTHAPPFEAAAKYEGKTSGPDYLPFYICKAAGDLIVRIMSEHPDKELMVLCGHTHGAAQLSVLPNVHVFVGAAEYERPALQKIIDVAA